MDTATARALIALNTEFYRAQRESFSATRAGAWEGWERALPHVERGLGATGVPRLLDLAAGNLRFERFCATRLGAGAPEMHAVDNCPELMAAAPAPAGTVAHVGDVLGALIDGSDGPVAEVPVCGAAVCFGFLHHVPTGCLRLRVLEELLGRCAPHGTVIVSFWQFMRDGRLARRAAEAERAAVGRGVGLSSLEPGDHLLGWQDSSALRYCHHFDDSEIDGLVAGVGALARETERFSADGRSHNLNRYLVLERL